MKKSHPESIARQPVGVHVDDPLPLPDWLVGLGRPFGPRVSCAGTALAEAGSAALRVAPAHCQVPETLGSREKREKLQENDGLVIGGMVCQGVYFHVGGDLDSTLSEGGSELRHRGRSAATPL